MGDVTVVSGSPGNVKTHSILSAEGLILPLAEVIWLRHERTYPDRLLDYLRGRNATEAQASYLSTMPHSPE